MTEKLTLPVEVLTIPGRQSRCPANKLKRMIIVSASATHSLSFLATLPPMSWASYLLTRVGKSNLEKETRDIITTAGDVKEVEVCSNSGQTLFYLPEVTGNKSNMTIINKRSINFSLKTKKEQDSNLVSS